MTERIARHVERLADRVMLAIVSTLFQVAKTRMLPESMEKIREEVERALHEAATAGKLDTLHPAQTFGPDQSMIDTRPDRTGNIKTHKKPPPLPPKK